jgi:opacity protein-like surface antigen
MCFAVVSNGFDDNREGFLLGFGLGYQSTDTEVEVDDYSGEGSYDGFSSTFKIGGGINKQFALYYVQYLAHDSDAIDEYFSIGGIGATYYFKPEIESAYILGAIGIGLINVEDDSESGTGLLLGAGYEFSEHWQIEGTYMSTDIEIEDSYSDATADITSASFQVTLNYLFY